jgi:hypothetical protein
MLRRHRKQGGTTEIRILQDHPHRSVYSGYFDLEHLDDLVELLRPIARNKVPYGEHPRIGEANLYVTLHPVNSALKARSDNQFSRCAATSDADIVAFDLVPIDIDPVRPAGIAATAAEKKHARKVVSAHQHHVVLAGGGVARRGS